jgi:hypothetical protein
VLARHARRRHALGFTDHDRDLAFDGTTFEAASGFTATTSRIPAACPSTTWRSPGGGVALRSEALNEDDLAAASTMTPPSRSGAVNWAAPAQRS